MVCTWYSRIRLAQEHTIVMLKKIISLLSVVTILFFSACLGVLFYAAEQPWVDFSVLERYSPGSPSILLDDEGHEWGRFELDKREVVRLTKIPPCVVHAFLAAEDWQFFSHPGLSFKGIIRSAFVNISQRRKAQGASTITQQLVRLLFFETRKSYLRKIQEQILAVIVEQKFTKLQILETYLNHIYLGAGIYGVEAACQRFWGKSVIDCTPDEAAVLASIVRCPLEYCPLINPTSSYKRRNLILKNMFTLGFITADDYKKAREKPVQTIIHIRDTLGAHMKETLRQFLEERFGRKQLYTGGLRIQTTINRTMQKAAQEVFKDHFKSLHELYSDELEGALVCIEGATGAIKALVGGCDFSASQFNRVTSAKRQMGSTFKPLIFAQALAAGKSFTDKALDEPLTLIQDGQEWSPGNADRTFMGEMTLAHALSRSNNIVTIRTFLESGPHEIVKLARLCGLTPTHAYPSLALGCLEASPLDTTAMINIFAHQGCYAQPYSIVWIKDEWGTKLYRAFPERKQVLDRRIAAQVGQVLALRIEQARNINPALWFSCEALGKSGTTNDSRTNWFVGATPRYTTGIYIGFDDNRPLGKWAFGSRTAFPIWRSFNKAIEQSQTTFTYDSSLKKISIHSITGEVCDEFDKQAMTILVPVAHEEA